ncbi:alpha-galactosidase [Mucilaginibacter gotjawali]|uniref:Alpha-galactosidase n=2 Tax=Mucilaginibacter gotjawali TaxID=1550579 RepID=A0A839SN82_9SPHI|nr:alpha-galactosidase [Mucilaginibacter gotjawali]MBB3057949.1 alpha-galactosidase [Mucilaginibacter gotjawali]BAU52279.1 Alpha-galactosidase [Mucilaginibacter gotjawali]
MYKVYSNASWKGIIPLLFLIISISTANAQSITIPVETKDNALVLQVSPEKYLNTVYFGKRLSDKNEYNATAKAFRLDGNTEGYNSAYTTAGSRNLLEPAIAVTHADGNQSLDLKYVSHLVTRINDDVSLLSIRLKDSVYDFEVTLNYQTYFNEDVTEQWSVITHHEKHDVTLRKYASANLYLQAGSYWLKHFHGDWAQEMRPEEEQLDHGIKTLDSKLGSRADLFEPPVFMVSLNKPSGEDDGEVLYGNMEWSGNYRMDFEVDPSNNLRLIAGINNYASAYVLKPGVEFTTPKFVYTLSNKGKGEASRNLQSWARKYKIVDGEGPRLTLLNNWESTFFDFDEHKLADILKDTKTLGVDLFLLDDGWFGNKYSRNGDHQGLGDWQENKAKLPDNIAFLTKAASGDGVKFGIWVEPEMVNPKSELYEKHPDWVVKQPQRPEYYMRNQLVLDLSNPKVQDFVFNVVDNLFVKNPDLAYIKWDCNSVIYNAHSAYEKEQSNFYTDYVFGLYKVLDRLRAKYPKVPMMLCSGGGGRVDYGALKYFTEYWPSDNTEPLERIFIQWEYSYFYPALASSNHVTNWGKEPIKFRVDVAMMGKLGFDIVVGKLKPDELEFCQDAVKTYKEFSEAIWHGDQYRLQDPMENDVASIMYVDTTKTNAIMFNYLVNNRYAAGSKLPIKLKGLNPDKNYAISEVNLFPGTQSSITNAIYSGKFLMTVGINPDVKDGRTSVLIGVKEQK